MVNVDPLFLKLLAVWGILLLQARMLEGNIESGKARRAADENTGGV